MNLTEIPSIDNEFIVSSLSEAMDAAIMKLGRFDIVMLYLVENAVVVETPGNLKGPI